MARKILLFVLAIFLISFVSAVTYIEQVTDATIGNAQTTGETGIKIYINGTDTYQLKEVKIVDHFNSVNPDTVFIRSTAGAHIANATISTLIANFTSQSLILQPNTNYTITVDCVSCPNYYRTRTDPISFPEKYNVSWSVDGRFLGGSNANIWAIDYYILDAQSLVTTLVSPMNNTNTINPIINMSISASPINKFKNATYYIWNSTGGQIFSNTSTILSQIYNLSSNGYGSYKWGAISCDTSDNCAPASNGNFTYNYTLYVINSETYTATTQEGAITSFNLNVSLANGQVTSAILNYNNTNYAGSFSLVGSNYIITRSLQAPDVTTATNFPFYWNVTTNLGDSFLTSIKNQTVSNIGIDNCSLNNITILNYFLKDEQTQAALSTDSSIEINALLSTLDGTLVMNYSTTKLNSSTASICASNITGTYRLDALAKYAATSYSIEYHNIQNYTLNSTRIPVNTTLFDLPTSVAKAFKITYKDANLLPVENAVIDVTRNYVGEGVFKTVEAPKTDRYGQAVAYFVQGDIIYTINVYKEGVLLATFSEIRPICNNDLTNECPLNLNALTSSTIPANDFDQIRGITYTPFELNRTSLVISTSYSTLNGASTNATLLVTKYDNFNNQTVCSFSLMSSSGSLSCTIPGSFQNTTVIAKLYSNNELIAQSYFTLNPSPDQIYGNVRVLFAVVMVLGLALMFIGYPVFMIIGGIMGLIGAVMLNLINGGAGIIGVGSTIIYIVIVAIIIIWRSKE